MRKRIAGAVAVAALAASLIGAGSAQATLSYDFSFGSPGTGPGQFSSNPSGIAINRQTGDLYVSDTGNNRIQQFDADGNFIRMWGQSVNQTSGGDVCPRPGNPGDVCKAGVAGFAPGSFNIPSGIAVDNSNGPAAGSVYVEDDMNSRIQRFTSDGQFVLMWGKNVNATSGGDICPRAGNPGDSCQSGKESSDVTGFTDGLMSSFYPGWGGATVRIAVDGAGYVYASSGIAELSFGVIVGPGDTRVVKFDSGGVFQSQVHKKPSGNGAVLLFPHEITVDDAGNLYVSDGFGSGLQKYTQQDFSPSGLTTGSDVTFPQVGENPAHFAIDPTNQYLFVADTGLISPCQVVSGNAQDHVVEYTPGGQVADCSPPTTPGMSFLNGQINALAVSPAHKMYMVVGSGIRVFDTPVASPPAVDSETATDITTTSALLKADVTANLADTTYHVEYGTSPCSDIPNPCDSSAESEGGASLSPKTQIFHFNNLTPDTTYYYRYVATNSEGSDAGPDKSFHTFQSPVFNPSCPNNLARQQTGSAFLLDCRAYELVSAENQGGYNVESDLIPGQTPFGGYPQADGKALYAVHDGGIPGTGKPTNRGPDPYLATRDAANQRWDTQYVGVPADAPSTSPFSSTLAGADSSLDTFAFNGPDICDPCFGDGSKGIPLHNPDGSLSQGMAGSIPVSNPVSAGEVKKPLSADGSHFIFGSEQQFEPQGNPDNGNVTIYARDLKAGTTEVLSTDTGGTALADGDNVAELDVSSNGSRVLIGDLVNTDSAGNRYWHLYMHVEGNPDSIDLTPGTPDGVLYDGMTSTGSMVYFTTKDVPTGASDGDTSADIFRADVSSSDATLTRVSTGSGAGDTDSCDPAGNSYNPDHWNTIPGAPTDCSVVAIGGGGGVASGSGAIYFLSPEQLDGNGVDGAPNLFLAKPGSEPHFVATLESGANSPLPPPAPNFQRSFGSFDNPEGVAIDQATGSSYVLDNRTDTVLTPGAYVQKFDSSGHVDSSFGAGGKIDGSTSPTGAFLEVGNGAALGAPVGAPTSLAVDNNPASPNYRDLYVPDSGHFAIDKFGPTGNFISQISLGDLPISVAVNQANGYVYVTGYFGNAYVFDANGNSVAPFSFSIPAFTATDIAVDSSGNAYVTDTTQTALYDSAGVFQKVFDANPSNGVAVDPSNDHVLVDEGNRVVEFTPAGTQVGPAIGSSILSGSVGLAADSGNLVVSNPGQNNVAAFASMVAANPDYDSPIVIDGVKAAETLHTGNFQTTPNGDFAVFPTVLPLTGFDSASKYELFRYDEAADQKICISCKLTGETPTGDATLASNGLSISDDGRVFFNTPEALTLRDSNHKLDAYEWASVQPESVVGACHKPGGCIELVSSGQSRTDSGLLTVSANGTDAFFFTRETFAVNDQNGNQMKLYDARTNGGFFVIPPQPECRASDECHGPGSQAAPSPPINTVTGTGGNVPSSTKKKHHKKHRHHKHRRHHHHSTRRHG